VRLVGRVIRRTLDMIVAVFFPAWWIGVFAGVFRKTWCSVWLFCGEFVVKCMVKAGGLTVFFRTRKFSTFFKLFFRELQGLKSRSGRSVSGVSLAFFTASGNSFRSHRPCSSAHPRSPAYRARNSLRRAGLFPRAIVCSCGRHGHRRPQGASMCSAMQYQFS
jgi:hypothetical protein